MKKKKTTTAITLSCSHEMDILPGRAVMCLTFYLELGGERAVELGTISCHLSGSGVGRHMFRSMTEDFADTDVRVVSQHLESYLAYIAKLSRCASAPIQAKATGELASELHSFAERCRCFSAGTVRLDGFPTK